MKFPNGAGYHDYEDVGLHMTDYINSISKVSDCCSYKVYYIPNEVSRCLKCLQECDVLDAEYALNAGVIH